MQEPLLTVVPDFGIVLRMLVETVVRHLHHVVADNAARLLQGLTLLRLARCAARLRFLLIGLLCVSGRLVALAHDLHNVVVLLLGQRLARGRVALYQHQRVQALHHTLPVLVVTTCQQHRVHARGRNHAPRFYPRVVDMGNGGRIAAQRQLHQSVSPVVVRQTVLHRVLFCVLDTEAVERLSQFIRHRTARSVLTHILCHILQLLPATFLYHLFPDVGLLHQPENVLRFVIHNAAQLACEFQHTLVPVTLSGSAALQFPPLSQQLRIRYAVVTVDTLLVLVEFYFPGLYSCLIAFSSSSFSAIKSALRIPLTVLLAVLLVV